jgi:NAD+-dependent protein deacetylase SIR2
MPLLTVLLVPDFRSSTGLFNTLRSQHRLKASGKHLFDAAVYKTDSSTTSFHAMVRELSHLTRSAQPTLFHHMLATLAEEGRLMRLYTQNVDGIDTALEPLATTVPLNPKGPWPRTIQLHGGLEKMVCTKCGELSNFNGALFEGPKPPSCESCEALEHVRTVVGKRSHGVGRLRPRIVLYNEFNPDEEAIGAVTRADIRNRPDAVIVVGTSLKVPGVRRIAREMCAVARNRRDGFTAWINNGPEPMGIEFKDCWDLVVRGDCDAVARHAALPRWDDKSLETYECVTGPEVETKPTVVLEVKDKILEKAQGILTPTASPRYQSPAPPKAVKLKQPKLTLKLPSGGSGALSETSHMDSTATLKKKTTKKTSRKGIAEKPPNKITDSFTVTKSSLITANTMKTTPVVEIPARRPPLIFPGLGPETLMPPISSSKFHNDKTANSHDDNDLLTNQLHESPLVSPQNQKPHNMETVSPKGSLPNGMARLLN